MSGVVIRCQHCGTTQATLGECEACHEGTTRYYCPNHAPGRWLDAPSCTACGARVGVPPKVVTPPPPPRRPSSPSSRPAPPPRRSRAEAPPPPRYSEPVREEFEETPVEEWPRARVVRPRDIVEEFLRARAARGGMGDPGGGMPMPSVNPFGCLRRLVMLVFALIVLAVLAFFGLFGVGGLLYGAASSGVVQPWVVERSNPLRAEDVARVAIQAPRQVSSHVVLLHCSTTAERHERATRVEGLGVPA